MRPRMKALLINPTAPAWRVTSELPPRTRTRIFRFSMLTSMYVAEAMRPYADVRIIDEDVEPVDFSADVDVVGISFMTYNAPRAYEIADTFRRRKDVKVIMGGYHPTFLPEEAIRHSDAVCIGEAEPNVPIMMKDLQNGSLRPFYREGAADLARLPLPDRALIRQGSYAAVDAIQATRGCPNRCTFCSISHFFAHTFRSRPVDHVIEELRQLGRHVLFLDDNITADHAYARELFSRMIPLKKRWYSQCSIGIAANPSLLDLAARRGSRGLFIGLESLSEENLHAWRKNTNRARDYARTVEKIHAAGIGVYSGIVFGADHDHREVFRHTLDFLFDANIDALQATILTPFPGTPLREEMARAGRIVDGDWAHYDFGHAVFEPAHMSREDLQAGHAWVLSRFYARWPVTRRLARGFGYLAPSTIFKAVLPLNVSYRTRLRAEGTIHNGIRPPVTDLP